MRNDNEIQAKFSSNSSCFAEFLFCTLCRPSGSPPTTAAIALSELLSLLHFSPTSLHQSSPRRKKNPVSFLCFSPCFHLTPIILSGTWLFSPFLHWQHGWFTPFPALSLHPAPSLYFYESFPFLTNHFLFHPFAIWFIPLYCRSQIQSTCQTAWSLLCSDHHL